MPQTHQDDEQTLDIVGIGALNLDYIAHAEATGENSHSLSSRISRALGRPEKAIAWGTEMSVDAQTIYAALAATEPEEVDASLGGSAFNAIHAIARIGLDLRLGYLGIAGQIPLKGASAVGHLAALGVDHSRVVTDPDALSGVCFAYADHGDRTLLTHAGANAKMADYLTERFDDLVAYLSRARILHVTSFLDDRTPATLAALLQAVKATNEKTLISFDPGHVWCSQRTPDIASIIAISDYLLVNRGEFRALGSTSNEDSPEAIAQNILTGMEAPNPVVLLKTPGGIHSYRTTGTDIDVGFYPHSPLAAEEIADSTGAGDVFAAGLLAVLASDELQVELGALLGMALARHKLRYVGSQHHSRLAAVTSDFMRANDRRRGTNVAGNGIFLSHGGRSDWLVIKDFIEERFGFLVHYFESDEWGSRQVTEALETYLEHCSLAICVMTGEDLDSHATRFPRQNVTHEAGLFHGRYGPENVIALVEEGCEVTADLPTPQIITYPVNGIDLTFWRLDQELRRRGFEPS